MWVMIKKFLQRIVKSDPPSKVTLQRIRMRSYTYSRWIGNCPHCKQVFSMRGEITEKKYVCSMCKKNFIVER